MIALPPTLERSVPRVLPRRPAPALDLPLVAGGRYRLADATPTAFSLLVFYRGLHCPKCKDQLQELDGMLDELAGAGIDDVVAVSGDTRERAERAVQEWGLERVRVAHDLTEDGMRTWDLYLSEGVKEGEPALFSEPALFLVEPGGTVYSAHVQSMPFARPHLRNLLASVGWIRENAYPARGEA